MSSNVRVHGEPGTLYSRCGGVFGIANFVDRCMDGWMESRTLNANAAVATWHQRWQRCGFKFLVAQLLGNLTGGPQQYTGRPMDVAHKHLNISGAEWEEFMVILHRVCAELNLDQRTTQEVDQLFAELRGDCVVHPGELVPPNPGPTPLTDASLYAQLGGVYPIALFVDRLVDALLVDERVNIPVDEERRTEASLKYLFTEVFCSTAGGRELSTCAELDETKLLVPKAAWGILKATAEVAADHLPTPLLPEILAALERARHLIVDPASQDDSPELSGAAQVKDVQEAAAGKKLGRAALAARHAAPGAHVAARRRVFGDPRTMYGRVGGVFGLARLSSRLMDAWMANPELNANRMVARWHETEQVYGFKFLVTQILGYLIGGPQRYTGRPMDVAHRHLSINPSQWDHFMTDADQVLEEFQVEPRMRQCLRAILADFKAQCVMRPGEPPWPDPGPSRPSEATVGTLYHSLGGVYPIARFVDRLVHLVLQGHRVQVESHPLSDLAGTRHPPGLKYVVTELICRGTGGPEVVTSRGFDPALLGVQPCQWPEFMSLVGEAAAEVFSNQQLRSALISAVRVLKTEICIGVEDATAQPSDAECKLREGEFGQFQASAALDMCGGNHQKALALLASGWAPEVAAGTSQSQTYAPPLHHIPRCPFAMPSVPETLRNFLPCASAKHSREPSDQLQAVRPEEEAAEIEVSTSLVDAALISMTADLEAFQLADVSMPIVVGRVLGNPLQDTLDDLLSEDPNLCCPVSLMLMLDPVIASDGFVYEKSSFQTFVRTGMPSPMSQEPLQRECVPARQQKEQVADFRRSRSRDLLEFAQKHCIVEPELVLPGLERVGEYVQVLRPDKEPELARAAAKVWAEMGHSVPPELTGGVSHRAPRRAKLAGQSMESPARSKQLSSGPRAAQKSKSDFQQRLHMLLSTEGGAISLAKKLYARFAGRAERLPEIQGFLEEKWGFPGPLFPILWSHLRRSAFGRRGEHVDLPFLSGGRSQGGGGGRDSPSPGGGGASVHVEEGEWVEAFVRWLQAIHARCNATRVSRQSLVQRRETTKASDVSDVYFQGPQLGEGAFGEVFVMLHKALGVERVVKVIKKDQLSTAEENIEGEVAVLKALDHPHIVRVYETFNTEDAHHIVMDFAAGGDLASLLTKAKERGQSLTEDWVCVATEQIAAALEYVHSNGVIHCDLKPANAMLLAPVDLEKNELPHVLLVDFGLSELFEERNLGGPVKMKGTPLYLSPEAFEGNLSQKSDMWAVGVMLYEMLLARRPFQEGNVFVLWSRIAKTEPSLEDLPPLASDLVKALLAKRAEGRPTAKECRAFEWFARAGPSRRQDAGPRKRAIGASCYFHRAAMFCIATELSMKDMGELFQVFQSIDTSKSGRLTLEQLSEGLHQLGVDQDPVALMAILDMDQNGYVSYTEFLAGVLSTDEDLSERLVREAFEMFDLDGDGSISMRELRSMLSGDGPLVDVLPDGQTLDEIMEEVGKGEGAITFANFKRYVRKAAKAAKKAGSPDRARQAPPEAPPTPEGAAAAPCAAVGSAAGEPDAAAAAGQDPFRLGDRAPVGLQGPLHGWLSEVLGEHPQGAMAVGRLLDFPAGLRPGVGDAAQHLGGVCRHFLAGACLARLLTQSPALSDDELRAAVVREVNALEAVLEAAPPECDN